MSGSSLLYIYESQYKVFLQLNTCTVFCNTFQFCTHTLEIQGMTLVSVVVRLPCLICPVLLSPIRSIRKINNLYQRLSPATLGLIGGSLDMLQKFRRCRWKWLYCPALCLNSVSLCKLHLLIHICLLFHRLRQQNAQLRAWMQHESSVGIKFNVLNTVVTIQYICMSNTLSFYLCLQKPVLGHSLWWQCLCLLSTHAFSDIMHLYVSSILSGANPNEKLLKFNLSKRCNS